uniref:Chloride channel protein n=1 Tax=Haemonchus placei TaxID=6290 RepID=A0A158QNP8_HAEPC
LDDDHDSEHDSNDYWDDDEKPQRKESMAQFAERQYRNVVHFFVEDWFLSAMLGIITAILSISTDVAIEYILHYRRHLYELTNGHHAYLGFAMWILFATVLVTCAALVCHALGKQAVGSGIPELKVIMHGFVLKNYLSLKTLTAKVIGLTLTLGSGMPVGKEGPFVHMGAIVASLLNKATSACQYNAFFSNEGRQMEMLSSGCAVGIACTFSAPAGAVLYGIESTSKYFAVKNYWRSFFATTCAALIFRFAIAAIVPQHIAGTITAYYQTNFPNEVFLIEEIPFFILLGIGCGLMGASFIWLHRRVSLFKKKNRAFRAVFGRSPIVFTTLFAMVVAILTYPEGFGRYIAGQYTFRETLADFLANCSFSLTNVSSNGCPSEMIEHWTGGGTGEFHPLLTLFSYLLVYVSSSRILNAGRTFWDTPCTRRPSKMLELLKYFRYFQYFLIAICVTLYIPAGIFVPCFVIGACAGRIVGEVLIMYWPDGFRGPEGPQIYPGLYAVVGAAAYTGAVTHSLSIAVIVCETTGQLCALLPVLIALMIGNAICSFLQPSIYESIINIQGYPYLVDLPPSRVSVHTMKVEKVMVKDIVFITRDTTYMELREILLETPNLRSYPFVTDRRSMTLLGSVARKYLCYLLVKHLGPEPGIQMHKRKSRTASELLHTIGQFRRGSNFNSNATHNGTSQHGFLTDRNISGNTLLAHSPLHENQGERGPLASLLYSQNDSFEAPVVSFHELMAYIVLLNANDTLAYLQHSLAKRAEILASKLDLDDVAIDPAPFQLVKGTSLYKVHTLFSLLALNHAYVTERGRLVGVVALKEVHTLFSLLALNHAYVTERGRLVGVVALKELREALSNIYSRGAVPIRPRVRTMSSFRVAPDIPDHVAADDIPQITFDMPSSSSSSHGSAA